MQLGLVGMGRMGANMMERLRNDGHEVVGYDARPDVTEVASLEALVAALDEPRAVWVMVPAGGPTNDTVDALKGLLSPGDLVIDGGNSRYTDSLRHAELLDASGIGFIDAGVSGGIWGLENGYALMVGGSEEHVERMQPLFDSLAPASGGYAHVGPVGAGHFTKMVHNGIEYALMQAYGEGYELLRASPLGIDAPAAFGAWREGSVVRSWLLDLLCLALEQDPELEKVKGWADDSGEGRWTVQEAIDLAVPVPAISAALFARFSSRDHDAASMKVIAALRNQFGGHAVKSISEA
ncbi:MAG: phosphogluconate dehydrogenase (NAD(+)-dependent, decarboxylating) [Acidimicrobiales bacterium]